MANSPDQNFTGTTQTPEHLAFDEGALEKYMLDNVEGYKGPLTVEKFKGGQSNPTYLISTPTKKYVLRRKPPGKLLPSAHAVDREYKVMTALRGQNFPVPKTYALCEDPHVIGTAFFVMDCVEGRILWDGRLPECDKSERSAIYNAMVDVLADLHQVDIAKAKLDDFGKHGDYFARQIARWSRQYRDSETETIEPMDALIKWLPENIPNGDETTLVHGDFRLDNMILDTNRPVVRAVLDWELSTLGHPLADFTYFLMAWHFPAEVRGGLAGQDLSALGIPTLEEMITRYAERTGRGQISDLNFCLAYNMFRLAAIVQGVYKRGLQGNASSKESLKTKDQIPSLAALGWFYAQKT